MGVLEGPVSDIAETLSKATAAQAPTSAGSYPSLAARRPSRATRATSGPAKPEMRLKQPCSLHVVLIGICSKPALYEPRREHYILLKSPLHLPGACRKMDSEALLGGLRGIRPCLALFGEGWAPDLQALLDPSLKSHVARVYTDYILLSP